MGSDLDLGERVWRFFLSVFLTLFCCGLGITVALTVSAHAGAAPSLLTGLLASLLPSLIAGVLLSWHLFYRAQVKEFGHDPLTGLFGAQQLFKALEVEYARAKRMKKMVGIVITELDQKDRFGVPEYVAWRSMARTLKAVVRLSDTPYVMSPGRFGVVLSETSSDGGKAVIERLKRAVREVPELYGVRIRYGQSALDPNVATDVDFPPKRVLDEALEAAANSDPETTVPPLPAPATAEPAR